MSESIDRREFTAKSIMALLSGVAITITACGSDSPAAPNATSDEMGTIANNHGHVAVVTAVQLNAGGGVTLDIKGSADHTHMVELNADDIVQIRANQRVTKTSTTTLSHTHTITFN